MAKLTILKVSIDLPDKKQDVVVPFEALKFWFRSGRFFRHLFRYQQARLITHRLDVLPRPLLHAMILRLFSHGAIYFEDETGKQVHITLKKLCSLAVNYLKQLRSKSSVVKRIRQQVQALLSMAPCPKYWANSSLSALYLRTDLAYGIRSGGSVGHIAGVLNNLDKFTGKPIFVTTDLIPTVREDITSHTVPLNLSYQDFPDSLILDSNHQITAYAEPLLDEVGFIYQRYSPYNFVGVTLACKHHVPFILEYNGSEVWQRRHWYGQPLQEERLARDIELLNFKAADVIVVVSKYLRDELLQLGIEAEKILVNPNGVDPERYSPQSDGTVVRQRYNLIDKIVIGFIGTFDAWHGTEILAEAFGKLLQCYPEYQLTVRLLLIGDGKKMPLAKEILERYGVLEYTIFTGRIPQVEGPQHLAACDILASPHVPTPDGTPFFGSPTKLFEYMAMGKGIVASALEQLDEVLSHLETAYMVKPGQVDDLVAGLKTLIDNPALRERLGATARREVVAKYTWVEHTQRIIEKLQERTQ